MARNASPKATYAMTSGALIVAADGTDRNARGLASIAVHDDVALLIARDGLTNEDAYAMVAEDANVAAAAVQSRKTYKAATLKAHALAVTEADTYYGKRDAAVIGATYFARTGGREGGAAAVRAMLEACKGQDSASTVAALNSIPLASKDSKPKAEKPLTADDVAAFLARVADTTWEGEDALTVLAAIASAGKAIQGTLAAE